MEPQRTTALPTLSTNVATIRSLRFMNHCGNINSSSVHQRRTPFSFSALWNYRHQGEYPISSTATTTIVHQINVVPSNHRVRRKSHHSIIVPVWNWRVGSYTVRLWTVILVLVLFLCHSIFHRTLWNSQPMKFLSSFLSLSSLRSNKGTEIGSTSSLAVRSNMNAVTIQPDGTSTSITGRLSSSLQKVIATALWSYFAGDAMSAPTHWFYGGFSQVQQYYGQNGITTYTKPSYTLQGSILNKSNLNGGGRSTTRSSSHPSTTIIGNVINHGKQDLWNPQKSIHYHATLEAGENTLEVSIARVLMRSIVDNHGQFNADLFRNAYITFMTTPKSHNDTYASTCHRMYFVNYFYKKLNPIDCPDNDHHNVDTIDGLVLPTITAMAVAGQPNGTIEQASQQAVETVKVTRNSPTLERYASAWGALVFQTIRMAASNVDSKATTMTDVADNGDIVTNVRRSIQDMAGALRLRTPQARSQDEITACYLDSAVPAMLDTMIKYMPSATATSAQQSNPITVWDAILRNANIGGENVHRGSCLGAIWGAVAAAGTDHKPEELLIPPQLVNGLYHHDQLSNEIQEFINSISSNRNGSEDIVGAKK